MGLRVEEETLKVALKNPIQFSKTFATSYSSSPIIAAIASTDIYEDSSFTAARGTREREVAAIGLLAKIVEGIKDNQSIEISRNRIRRLGGFLDEVYMKKMYLSLDYLTPMEFENQWKEQQKETTEVTA